MIIAMKLFSTLTKMVEKYHVVENIFYTHHVLGGC